MIYNNILETIGNTPVVRLNRMAPKNVTVYVKLEAFNPMASVKDRLAFAIVNDAEQKGELKPGQTVVEATSGNTGIALAMVCAARGYPFVAIMPETFSIERRKIMRGLGAKVILTPAAERGSGMVRRAEELAEKHGWFLARQFENPANPAYHREHHRPGDPAGLRGQTPRLLGHRLGHRRHALRCGARPSSRSPGPEDRRMRTGGRGAARRQGVEAAQDPGLDAGLRAGGARSRHLRRADGGRPTNARSRRARTRDEGRHLLRHLVRRHASPRRSRSRRRRRGQRHPGDAAGHGERYLSTPSVRRRERRFRRRLARKSIARRPRRR